MQTEPSYFKIYDIYGFVFMTNSTFILNGLYADKDDEGPYRPYAGC